MKSTLISMLIVLVIMVALPMILLGGHKLPDLSGFHFVRPGASGGIKLASGITDVTTNKPVSIYRWRDAHGIVQLSNTKPVGVKYEEVQLKPNLSSMDPTKPLPSDLSLDNKPASNTSAANDSGLTNPYTPSGMKQLLSQAKTLKQQLARQQSDQAKVINQMLGKSN